VWVMWALYHIPPRFMLEQGQDICFLTSHLTDMNGKDKLE